MYRRVHRHRGDEGCGVFGSKWPHKLRESESIINATDGVKGKGFLSGYTPPNIRAVQNCTPMAESTIEQS